MQSVRRDVLTELQEAVDRAGIYSRAAERRHLW